MGGNERTGSACSGDGAVIVVVVDVRRLDDGPCPCRVYKYECLVESTSPSDDDDDDDDTVGKDIVLMIRLHIHIFASKPAAATTT